MNNQSPSSRRAALRAMQEAEARKKRLNRILIAAASVVAAIIIGIVGVVVWQQVVKTTNLRGEQITPPNATSGFGVAPFKAQLKEGAPRVVIWEDPQCPWCMRTSQQFSEQFNSLAKKGEISLEYRVVNILDAGLRNDASLRATRGTLIADKYGKFAEYLDEVYKAQPEREGDGFSDELLRNQIPEKVGITGEQLSEFQKLYDQKATDGFLDKTVEQGRTDDVRSTPTILVNGKKVDMFVKDASNKLVPAAESTDEALLSFLKAQG